MLLLRYLTFDSELLLDVLEVVGIFGVDGTVGSCDRHVGDVLLVSGARQWYLFGFAIIICEHFAGGVLSILKMTQTRLYFGDAGHREWAPLTSITHSVCATLLSILEVFGSLAQEQRYSEACSDSQREPISGVSPAHSLPVLTLAIKYLTKPW